MGEAGQQKILSDLHIYQGIGFQNQENYPELMNKSIDLVVKMRDVLKEYVLAEL